VASNFGYYSQGHIGMRETKAKIVVSCEANSKINYLHVILSSAPLDKELDGRFLTQNSPGFQFAYTETALYAETL
jgi:hypothetical protein